MDNKRWNKLFHRLLSLHPTLKHLYEDLVISKVINSEEYWNTPTLKHYTESTNMKQEAGENSFIFVFTSRHIHSLSFHSSLPLHTSLQRDRHFPVVRCLIIRLHSSPTASMREHTWEVHCSLHYLIILLMSAMPWNLVPLLFFEQLVARCSMEM